VLIGDEKLLTEEAMIVTVALPPWATVIELAEDESEKLG